MFLKESSAGKTLNEKISIFKGRINDRITRLLNTHCKILIPQEIEYIPLSTISWLLAISVIYKDHAEIDLDSRKLYLKAKSINRILFEDLYGTYYLPPFNEMRRINSKPTESQIIQFLETLKELGISEDVASYRDFEDKSHWNFGMLRKDLIIQIITKHPRLADSLICSSDNATTKSISKNPLCKINISLNTEKHLHSTRSSNNCSDKSQTIRIELENLLLNNNTRPQIINKDTLWAALIKNAEVNPESLLEKKTNKTLKEKNSDKIWDKEAASYHISAVLKWFNYDTTTT